MGGWVPDVRAGRLAEGWAGEDGGGYESWSKLVLLLLAAGKRQLARKDLKRKGGKKKGGKKGKKNKKKEKGKKKKGKKKKGNLPIA